MATKNYMINDKWLDLDKQNIVELQSVDGVLDSLKVNGSEIETPSGKITITENGTDIDVAQYATADVAVEGGGGGGDFSTAEVTVTNNITGSEEMIWDGSVIENNVCSSPAPITEGIPQVLTIILYKGSAQIKKQGFGRTVVTSGNASYDSETDILTITGDCTVTYSEGSLPPLP